ncbi:hypothetical protein CTI12_AA612860 [Artemisia annua]|uniref:Uncharacterized protein n=1 Tax=Artemisia annua TaxID=35608 RepID=A0A2U1KE86_ARTAN|nr:hypothetical protein CTI12_AA612860 [Artemisia annua]
MMTIDSDAMEIDDTTQTNKKRKFPDGIGEGVSLLQNGLRVIASGLSLWQQNQLDYSDLQGEFLTRFSNLEDAVGQMAAIIYQINIAVMTHGWRTDTKAPASHDSRAL